ncbi:MAG: purine-nucleoside phosphorylase [Clostridia bacterium]|nr:purine-nucleoside phosphorylase [Clostridia bacterium]
MAELISEKAAFRDYQESAAYISKRIGGVKPDIAIILGSGLGNFAERLSDAIVIPYREIPNFPTSTVSYQKGELVFGLLTDNGVTKKVLAMNGRFHYYEGWEMWQTAYPVGVFRLLGIDTMIVTNAAGGIGYNDTRTLRPGDLVCVTDQIKLAPISPVRGPNIAEFGPRFFDMQSVFAPELRRLAAEVAAEQGFALKEGVYAYMSGPQYETPAEIRALKILGANLVGMSTVAETIFAAQLGIRVLCISCVTNMAAGITGAAITEQEVLDVAAEIREKFTALVTGVITRV